jgi:aspartyl-tRNA(Asn)/glutamyl-tRNA(Gln) amidotransferase subunit B
LFALLYIYYDKYSNEILGKKVLKPYISLEARILLPAGVKTFCPCGPGESCPVCRGEGGIPRLNPLAFRKAALLIRGLSGTLAAEAPYELKLRLPPVLSDPSSRAPVSLSRFSLRLGTGASIDIMFHRRKKRVEIPEIRLEEDAGRLIREGGEVRIDYSRAGMPSLRIRTAPDFEIGEETGVFVSTLRRRIQYLGIVSDLPGSAVPESPPGEEAGGRAALEGLIRCNAYVAIATYPNPPVGFIKLRNLNSFNFVAKAVNAELSRQEKILTGGGIVMPESRIWNESKNASEFFKAREAEQPEFSLPEGIPPFRPDPELLADLPEELPESRCRRLMNDYGLTQFQAEFLCDEKSRADYFEETASFGVDHREAAQWMASYVVREFKRAGFSPATAPLTPERFARILRMLRNRRIHGSIAKQIIPEVLKENGDPRDIIRKRGWEQLDDRKTIEGIVRSVIEGNPQEVGRIREGDSGPVQFLAGLVMKESGGLADPILVRDVLREQLSVSLVYVFSMGGAISGRLAEDGTMEAGDEQVLRELLARNTESGEGKPRVRVEAIPVRRILSEEIVPDDWAVLVESVAEKLNSGNAKGIVIAHGTDTLSYTAPLLYWLFADSGVPIVLAASSTAPGQGSEAGLALKKAIDLALKKPKGVYVVHGGKVLSPLNLKFERIGRDGFRNWNQGIPVFSGGSLLTGPLEADRYILSQLLEEAVNSICVIRIYPGLRADYLVSLMDRGVKNFFLELYDTGTAGFRKGPYSLKKAFGMGKRRGVRFYCSSQQEGLVDFSLYASSREIWREGAIPMGPYTTETSVARFLAASIIADSEDERAELMEGLAGEPVEL